MTQLVHLGQQRIFLEESGLRETAPGAKFTFTRPEGYAELLDNVKVHGWDMMIGRNEFVPRPEVARHWFAEVYLPTIALIREADLPEMWDHMTVDDIFLWVTERWRKLFPERGPLSFEEVITEAAEERPRKPPT